MQTAEVGVLNQHVIDPEICIRCNTCEAICPVGAITHDSMNYVVKADVCNFCMACVPPCPTGSIDNWRKVPIAKAYSIEEQFTWDALPAPLADDELQAAGADVVEAPAVATTQASTSSAATTTAQAETYNSSQWGSSVPPWSAAHPYVNLHGPKAPVTATVVGNVQVNDAGTENETPVSYTHLTLPTKA